MVAFWLPVLVMAFGAVPAKDADPATIDKKLMCGYQGWFRCPGDAADMGWIHWSRDSKKISAKSLTFEMWPDVSEYGEAELYAAPGFTLSGDATAKLFSSDDARTVQRHFEWMRDSGIDGAWLQHFAVDLPGGPSENRHASRLRVVGHVQKAAAATGRVWALAYDVSAMPADKIYEVVSRDWKRMAALIEKDPRYLHHGGKPVVQLWGMYRSGGGSALTAKDAVKLIDDFKKDGPLPAYVVGGGDWNWRGNFDDDWKKAFAKLDAYMPWNVGNYSEGGEPRVKSASTGGWAEDAKEAKRLGVRWIPVVYPGFSWDNLKGKPPGTTTIPRRKGELPVGTVLRTLRRLGVDSAFVAMFDEVDEATAIFKVSEFAPETKRNFLGLEGIAVGLVSATRRRRAAG